MAELYVVGIGPGNAGNLTGAAREALEKAALICGYTVYADLLRPLYPEKEYYTTGMTGEIERCRHCLERAAAGETVALVCSGDAGVYGMAGPVRHGGALGRGPAWRAAGARLLRELSLRPPDRLGAH